MDLFPLIEIVFYIAALFAPIDTSEIIVSHTGSTSVSYTRAEAGWKSSKDNTVWKQEGMSVVHPNRSTDLSEFVKGAETHQWSELSILKLSGQMEVLKVSESYWVYPSGIESPNTKWMISYKIKSDK